MILTRPTACVRYVTTFALLGVVGCNAGTEGDNPFQGTVDPSPCKGEAEYAAYLDKPLTAYGESPIDPDASYGMLGQALVSEREIPVALECLEWTVQGNDLHLVISNFSSGCGINWTGSTSIEQPGHIVVELSNGCLTAACFSCGYDTRADISATRSDLLGTDSALTKVELRLVDCEGIATGGRTWSIPLSTQAQGIACAAAFDWFAYSKEKSSGLFSESQLNLYGDCARTDEFGVECTENRTCVSGHCVPPCTTDADCPVAGALTCQQGNCLLP